MTNVTKNPEANDMQMHIKSAFDIIEKHLPYQYVPKVQSKLTKSRITGISAGTIRNVKAKGAVKPFNFPVITALLEVAKENKALTDQLTNNLNESDDNGNPAE